MAVFALAKYLCGLQGRLCGLQGRRPGQRAAANRADTGILATPGSAHLYRAGSVHATVKSGGGATWLLS